MNSLAVLLCVAPLFVLFIVAVGVPRLRMERRARALLRQHPDAERTSVYLPLASAWTTAKQREIDAKIAEMDAEGWIFVRATEASPLRTVRSWGGGVNLQFVRA